MCLRLNKKYRPRRLAYVLRQMKAVIQIYTNPNTTTGNRTRDYVTRNVRLIPHFFVLCFDTNFLDGTVCVIHRINY